MDVTGTGPFENGHALALLDRLALLTPDERLDELVATMHELAWAHDDTLTERCVFEGLAAAVLMSAWSGGPHPDDPLAAGWLAAAGPFPRYSHSLLLARACLDRALPNSRNAWADRWRAQGLLGEAAAVLDPWRGSVRRVDGTDRRQEPRQAERQDRRQAPSVPGGEPAR